jgi:hypothetical protein
MRILATLLVLLGLAACSSDDSSSGPYVGGSVGSNGRNTNLR